MPKKSFSDTSTDKKGVTPGFVEMQNLKHVQKKNMTFGTFYNMCIARAVFRSSEKSFSDIFIDKEGVTPESHSETRHPTSKTQKKSCIATTTVNTKKRNKKETKKRKWPKSSKSQT